MTSSPRVGRANAPAGQLPLAPSTDQAVFNGVYDVLASCQTQDSRRLSRFSGFALILPSPSGYPKAMHTPPTAPLMGLTDTMAGVAREDSPMSTLPSPNGQPLVDLAVLRELEQQVDDPSIVVGFVHDFVDLWESRYERLAQALDPLDPDTALDALISIKTAAAMAGAVRLAGDARELGEAVKRGDEAAAKALLPILASCGQQTLLQLQEHYPKSKEQG